MHLLKQICQAPDFGDEPVFENDFDAQFDEGRDEGEAGVDISFDDTHGAGDGEGWLRAQVEARACPDFLMLQAWAAPTARATTRTRRKAT